MPRVEVKLSPGIVTGGTPTDSKGFYRDSNLIRWNEGTLETVGGWTALNTESGEPLSVEAPSRGSFSWVDRGGNVYVAVGTETSIFIVQPNGTRLDVTPLGFQPPSPDMPEETGLGRGSLGEGPLGTTYPSQSTLNPALRGVASWSFDNWGENLVACNTLEGKLYQWQPGTDKAELVSSSAPIDNTGVLVTDQRVLMTYGANKNSRRIQWSDLENLTEWTPGRLPGGRVSVASSVELECTGAILKILQVRNGLLVLTTKEAFIGEYTASLDQIYTFTRIGSEVGLLTPRAVADASNGAYWIGQGGFYTFDGIRISQLPCSVHSKVFGELSLNNQAKVFALQNQLHNEVTWYYPISAENTRYVTYNYLSNLWYFGELDRSSGIDSGFTEYPLLVDNSGNLWYHEYEDNHHGRVPHIRTGPLPYKGEKVASITRVSTDERFRGSAQVRFHSRYYPDAEEYIHGPYDLTSQRPTSVRFTGRFIEAEILFKSNIKGTLGQSFWLDMVLRGMR